MLYPACSVILYERVALNKFLRGKVKGTNIFMRRMAQKVCSIKSGPFLIS